MLDKRRPQLKPGAQRAVWCIEVSVLLCMALVMVSSIVSIYGAQKMIEAFDGNCFFTSNISFVPRNPATVPSTTTIAPISTTSTTISSTTISPTTISSTTVNSTTISPTTMNPTTISTTINPTTPGTKKKQRKISHIFRNLGNEYVEEPDTEIEGEFNISKAVHIRRDQVQVEADFNFLATMQVDIVRSLWAPVTFCEYVLYNQILASVASMVCATMLILYNSAGHTQLDWGIDKPWRIVFPAVISFGIMTIVAIVHIVIVEGGYKDFCNGLSSPLQTKTLPCSKLIIALRPFTTRTWLNSGNHYMMHTVSIHLTLIGWCFAFVIMLARMIFVIDFRLVRVTVSKFTHAGKSAVIESSPSDSVDDEENADYLKAGPSKQVYRHRPIDPSASSREDLEDFESARSHIEGFNQPSTSHQALIYDDKLKSSKGVDV